VNRVWILLVLALTACDAVVTTEHEDAVAHGAALFESRSTSPSKLNDYTCATCHQIHPGASDIVHPGAPMAGVTVRTRYWGGQELDLLTSINDCRYWFMNAQKPWTADDPEARAMYAWLTSLPADLPTDVSFTVPATVQDLLAAEVGTGAQVFARACQSCHGKLHTGSGRLSARIPRLPEDPLAEHTEFTAIENRLIFIEKVRHGGFFGYGGTMPPFSTEVLSDAELQALLAYFHL
jgi:thiosulfate dehydrogenase